VQRAPQAMIRSMRNAYGLDHVAGLLKKPLPRFVYPKTVPVVESGPFRRSADGLHGTGIGQGHYQRIDGMVPVIVPSFGFTL
jgi:hypothetical protein